MPTFDDIQLAVVRRFFKNLRDKPFIALVVDGDDVHVYMKGVAQPDLRNLMQALEAAEEEEHE